MYVCVYIYIYIYTYTQRVQRVPESPFARHLLVKQVDEARDGRVAKRIPDEGCAWVDVSRRSSGMMSYDVMQYGTVGYDTCTMLRNCYEWRITDEGCAWAEYRGRSRGNTRGGVPGSMGHFPGLGGKCYLCYTYIYIYIYMYIYTRIMYMYIYIYIYVVFAQIE